MFEAIGTLIGVDDPFDTSARCGRTQLIPVDPGSSEETFTGVAWVMARMTLLWCISLYISALCAKLIILPRLPRSSVEKENTPFHVGQKIPAFLRAVIVSGLANICLCAFWSKSIEQNFLAGPAIEIAGMFFTSFEIADLLVGVLHGMMGLEYLVHHLLHIGLGLIIRGNCVAGLLAAVLMAQETSGIFLNYFLLIRNRYPDHWSVKWSFVLFAAAFFVYRIGLGTFGTYFYVRYYNEYLPPTVPSWQGHLIAVVIVLASLLQWYWGWVIAGKVITALSAGGKSPVKTE